MTKVVINFIFNILTLNRKYYKILIPKREETNKRKIKKEERRTNGKEGENSRK